MSREFLLVFNEDYDSDLTIDVIYEALRDYGFSPTITELLGEDD